MQSSNTPGYQKVQTYQPDQEVTINIQNNQPYTIKTSAEMHEENDADWWKQLGISLIGPAILAAIGGATKLGKHLSSKLKLDRSELKFDKDQTFDQSLLKMGNFSLKCNEMRETINKKLAEAGDTLTEESKKQIQGMLKEIDQQEYYAYKDLINRWSLGQDEIKTINMEQSTLKEAIQKLEERIARKKEFSGKQIDQDINLSEELQNELQTESQRLTEKYLKRDGELKSSNERSLIERIQNDSPDKLANYAFDKGFSVKDQKLVQNLHKKIVDEKNAEMKRREEYYMTKDNTSIESLEQQIAEKQNQIDKLQSELDVGVQAPLKSWLENLPEGYKKTKQGLIDYVFDEFENNKRQPEAFDQKIFEYNMERNNPILRYSVDEGTWHKQKQLTQENARKFLQEAANQTTEWTNKLKLALQIIPENIRNNSLIKPLVEAIEKTIESGNIDQKQIIESVVGLVDQIETKAKTPLETAKKILVPADGRKSLLNKASELYQKYRLKFSDSDISMIQSLVTNGEKVLDEIGALKKFLTENIDSENFQKEFINYMKKYSQNLGSIGNEIKKITDWAAGKKNLPQILDNLFLPGKWKDVIKPALDMVHQSGVLGKTVSRFLGNLPSRLLNDKFGLLSDLLTISKKFTGKEVGESFMPVEKALDALSYYTDPEKWRTNPEASRKYLMKTKNNQIDYFDLKNLLSQDLQEQERIVKGLTDKHNIFWRDYVEVDGKPLEQFIEQSIKPTEEERKFIEEQSKLQQQIQSQEQYILYNDLVGKQTTEQMKDQLKRNLSQSQTNLKSQKGFKQQEIERARQEYKTKINELNEMIKLNKADLAKQQIPRDESIQKSREYENAIQDLNSKISVIDKEIKENQDYINSAMNDNRIKNMEDFPQKKGLLKRITTAGLDKAKQFTGIGKQSVDSIIKNIAKSNDKIDQLNLERQSLKDKLTDNQKMLNEQNKNLSTTEKLVENANKTLAENQEKLNQLVSGYKQQIKGINNKYSETIAKLNKEVGLNKQKIKDIENLEDTSGLNTENDQIVYSNGNTYQLSELQKYLAQENEKIENINSQLSQYEPQMNWMNAEKYNDELSAAQRYRVEELFHTQRRNQEKMRFDIQHGIWVPRPLYNNTWLEMKKQPVDSIETTSKKLEKLGYKPETSYYLDGEQKIIDPEDAVELQYNPYISEELQKLKSEYYDKMYNAKSFDRPKIKQEYENARQQKLQEIQNQTQMGKQNENPMILMSELLRTQKPLDEITKSIEDIAGTYYDRNKSSRKQEWVEFRKQFPNKKTQRNDFINLQKQEMENLENVNIDQDTIKDWNKFINKFDPGNYYDLKLPEKSTKQTWKNYLYQFDDDYLGYKPVKAEKGKSYSYPADDMTFRIRIVDEVPIRNYLEDLGLNQEDMDITKQRNFFTQSDKEQLAQQLQLIEDDILPKYDGDDRAARAWKELFTQRIDKIKYPVQSKVYNTHQLQRILNNLNYVYKKGLMK